MTAYASLIERPVWELALGASTLMLAAVVAALVFFWIGFRIAEIPAIAGFEGMFGLGDGVAEGSARVVPREVAARLQSIQSRAAESAERLSLDELAGAMDYGRARTSTDDAQPDATRASGRKH